MPYGLQVLSPLSHPALENNRHFWPTAAAVVLDTRSGSQIIISHDDVSCHSSTSRFAANSFSSGTRAAGPILPPLQYSLFYITLRLLSSCFRSLSDQGSTPSHAGHHPMGFWATPPPQSHFSPSGFYHHDFPQSCGCELLCVLGHETAKSPVALLIIPSVTVGLISLVHASLWPYPDRRPQAL